MRATILFLELIVNLFHPYNLPAPINPISLKFLVVDTRGGIVDGIGDLGLPVVVRQLSRSPYNCPTHALFHLPPGRGG